MADNDNALICPFCGYADYNDYVVQLHIEERHTDRSPFVARDRPLPAPDQERRYQRHDRESAQRLMPSGEWTKCTRPGCGEYVLLSQIDDHLDLHVAKALSEKQQPPLPTLPNLRSPLREPMGNDISSNSIRKLEKHRPETSRRSSHFSNFFSGTSNHSRSTARRPPARRIPGRLGKRELGPYANENRMPQNVRDDLLYGASPTVIQCIGRDGRLVEEEVAPNETAGLIRILADICSLEKINKATYLCHPSIRHVRKIYCDGNFCGYWSIQTVLTYIQHMNPGGPQKIPHVIRMQELIENAWERGICSYSKVETGGIMNTRKWIGTQEALAFFTRIDVQIEALAIGGKEDRAAAGAAEELLDYVEAYFMGGIDTAQRYTTSHITQLAPIYFQQPGHSMVIVGLERQKDGRRNLLVFDSSHATSEPMKRLLNGRQAHASPDSLLRTYRRSESSLRQWDEFEILMCVPPRPH